LARRGQTGSSAGPQLAAPLGPDRGRAGDADDQRDEQLGPLDRGPENHRGDARLEAACAKATAVGDPSYRTLKSVLVAGTETDPETGEAGAAPFLHGPAGLFAADAAMDPTDDVADDQGRDEDGEDA
jgi:hypothetical protein